MILPFTDLNLKPRFCEPSDKVISRQHHDRRQTGVRATDVPSSVVYVSTNFQTLRQGAQNKDLLVPRPVSLHGVRATYLQREFARHRGLFAHATYQSLSPRNTHQTSRSQHASQRQCDARLAYVCRLRAKPHHDRTVSFCRRTIHSRFKGFSLGAGCQYNLSISLGVSLGALLSSQSGHEVTHAL